MNKRAPLRLTDQDRDLVCEIVRPLPDQGGSFPSISDAIPHCFRFYAHRGPPSGSGSTDMPPEAP